MTSEDRLPLTGLWGEIQAAVNEQQATAQLWETINQAAAARGYSGTTGGLQLFNELRSLAVGIREAAARFAAAGAQATIDTTMYAPDLNAQYPYGRTTVPNYRIRYQQTIQTIEGQIVSAYRQLNLPGFLPSTKQEVLAEVEASAQANAERYGEQHLAVFDVVITVV